MPPPDTSIEPRRIRPVELINAAACTVWFATAIACLRPATWPFELANHLHVLYLIALLPVLLLCLATRRLRFAAAHAVFVGAVLWVMAPAWLAADEAPPEGLALSLAVLNVNSGNRDHALVVDLLRREQPDVVVFLEVNNRWMRVLQDLVDLYPHRHAVPRPDNFGIAVLGRQPLDAVTRVFGSAGLPSVIATVHLAGRAVQLVATHPLPPMRPSSSRERDEQVRAVADYVRAQTDPLVLAGDLNTSPWAPVFQSLLDVTGLRDPRRGRGVLATWPSRLPLIGIDHVLVSPQLGVSSLRVGPAIGSDHRPLLARVQFGR